MMTLIAAALAAAQPVSAPAADAHAQHEQAPADHKGMDCCKDCCKEMMDKMHSGHDMKGMHDHQDHGAR
jgi:hypothetical protein